MEKDSYDGGKTASATIREGQAVTDATLALPELPDGASYAESGTVGGTDTLIFKHNVSGTTLTYSMAAQDGDTSTTITIPVTGAANYNDYSVTVTISVISKAVATISGISVDGKTYDGTSAAYRGTAVVKTTDETDVTSSCGTLIYTWYSGGTALASAPKDAGSYKLVVSVSGDNEEYKGSQVVSFTIAKTTITIAAENKTARVYSEEPSYPYIVTGLASGETLKTNPVLTCSANMSEPGTYEIIPGGAEAPDGNNCIGNRNKPPAMQVCFQML